MVAGYFTLRVYITLHNWLWKQRLFGELQPKELQSLIVWSRNAVSLTPTNARLSIRRSDTLARLLDYRFITTLQRRDLDESIQIWKDLVASESAQTSSYPPFQLSHYLFARYFHYGDTTALHSALQYARQAVDCSQTSDEDFYRAQLHEQLSHCLDARAQITNNYQDHLDAIALMYQVLTIAPTRGDFLFSYAEVLRSSVDFQGDWDHEAVLCAMYNSAEYPGGPSRFTLMLELGRTYSVRRREGDMERAASLLKQAISLAAERGRVDYARALLVLAEVECELEGLSQALDLVSQAEAILPNNHVLHKEGIARTISNILVRRQGKSPFKDIYGCLDALAEIARSEDVSPSIRYRSALIWSSICAKFGRTDAIEAYTIAVELLPRLVWAGLPNDLRLRSLAVQGIGLASSAAATVIQYYPEVKLERSVEMLEAGRSIFWTHFLQLRTPFDQLAQIDAKLAEDLAQTSKEIEAGSSFPPQLREEDRIAAATLSISRDNHLLSDRWDKLVGKARSIQGFEDFLRPKQFSQLSKAARDGVVIMVNVDSSFCDALVVRSEQTLQFVTLPLTQTEAVQLAASWKSLLKRLGRSYRSPRNAVTGSQLLLRGLRKKQKPSQDPALQILSSLWTQVVEPILEVVLQHLVRLTRYFYDSLNMIQLHVM